MQYVVTYKGRKWSLTFTSLDACATHLEATLRCAVVGDDYGIAEYHLVPLVKKVVTTTTWEKADVSSSDK